MRRVYDVVPGSDSAFVSGARVLLGLFLLATAVLTFFVPDFRAAFNSQLSTAGFPLAKFSLTVIPIVEGIAGIMLMQGVLVRLACLVSVLLMGLMSYLHLVVDEPTFYPQQFDFPLIPVVALIISAFLYFVDSYGEEV